MRNKEHALAMALLALMCACSDVVTVGAVADGGSADAARGERTEMKLTVKGPIEVTSESGPPFHGTGEQNVSGTGVEAPTLDAYDYVEEEYFISGNVDDGPFTTSLLVRKPKDSSKFSGLVAIETVHAAGALPLWGFSDVWLKGGHAWIAVTSQLSALDGQVKPSNPTRYADLKIPTVVDSSSQSPLDLLNGGPQDDVSQAIMTQVGTFLKSTTSDGPLGGYDVAHLVMGGSSQTGSTTIQYILKSHASAKMPDGTPIYDGYVPMNLLSAEPLAAEDARIVDIVTEGDIMVMSLMNRGSAVKEASQATADGYRHYEVTAGSHVTTRGITDPAAVSDMLNGVLQPGEQLSQFPSYEIFKAIITGFVDWVMNGEAPNDGVTIDAVSGAIQRDDVGNARGGVRSAYVDVPTVHYIASAPLDSAASPTAFFRGLIGLQEPLAADALKSRYGTQEKYLSKFNHQIDKMVEDHWLLEQDADHLKTEESMRDIF